MGSETGDAQHVPLVLLLRPFGSIGSIRVIGGGYIALDPQNRAAYKAQSKRV